MKLDFFLLLDWQLCTESAAISTCHRTCCVLYFITSWLQKEKPVETSETFTQRRWDWQRPEEIFTFSIAELLAEAEVVAAHVLHVVFFNGSLNHLRRVVLTGQLERKGHSGSVIINNVNMTYMNVCHCINTSVFTAIVLVLNGELLAVTTELYYNITYKVKTLKLVNCFSYLSRKIGCRWKLLLVLFAIWLLSLELITCSISMEFKIKKNQQFKALTVEIVDIFSLTLLYWHTFSDQAYKLLKSNLHLDHFEWLFTQQHWPLTLTSAFH